MLELDRSRPQNPMLDLKLPHPTELPPVATSPVSAPLDPEPRTKAAAPAWAKALAADGDIEKEAPRLTAEARKIFDRFFSESPAYSNLPDQSLGNRTETQRTLLKSLGIPESEVVVLKQDGRHHVLGVGPKLTIVTEQGTLECNANGYFAFSSAPNKLTGGTAADQFAENAQIIAKLFKQSPNELLQVQRGKPVSEEFSKQLTATLKKSLNPKIFDNTSLSAYYDKEGDLVRVGIDKRYGDADTVFSQIDIPFSELEKPGAPAARIYSSRLLKSALADPEALGFEHGTKSVGERNSKNISLRIPHSMDLGSLSLYGVEFDGNSITRYDPKTKQASSIHTLTENQTAIFRFDRELPGIRATILDGKKQEGGTFTFKR